MSVQRLGRTFLSHACKAAAGRAAALVLLCGLGACRPADAPTPVAPAAAHLVGDAVCASCHEDLAASYARTGMGRSMSRFTPASAVEQLPSPTVRDATRGLLYDAFVRGDTLFQRERRMGADGSVVHERVEAVAYVVGSGHATRSYLMDVGGHLTEMPLTWYVERRKWDLSPGYAQTNDRFDRPIVQACLTCHTATPAYSAFTQNHFTEVPLGIACERCHGPGSRHAEARLAGQEVDGPDPTIVNPAHLDRARQLSVCQQCHLSGTEVFREGQSPATFMPGQRLSDNRIVFATAEQVNDPQSFGISSHAERLARSACFETSAMTCTTCHDPHRSVAETGPETYSNACRSCHNTGHPPAPDARPEAAPAQPTAPACAVPAHNLPGVNCVSCHLQKAGTSDIPHVTFTDHWIRRRLPPKGPAAGQNLKRTTPFRLVQLAEDAAGDTLAPAEAALDRAAGTFTFYETKHTLPAYLPLVKAEARRGLAGGADLAEARLALARALMLTDSLDAAAAVLRDAVAAYPQHARLLYWQGSVLRRLGRPGEALAPLQAALAVQPHFVEARTALAGALGEAGRTAEAEQAYRAALAESPKAFAGAWNDLGFLLLQQQRYPDAEPPLARAVALDPDLTPALLNLGTLRLALGQPALAEALFGRVLAREPNNVAALANRGVIAAQAGRIAEAKALFRRVVTLSPADTRAQNMLAQLEAMAP